MSKRKCKTCGDFKDKSKFHKSVSNKDGLCLHCRECYTETVIKYIRTKKGVFSKIYSRQRKSSKIRGHNPPLYTLKELRNKYIDTDEFNELYRKWVDSGFKRSKSPSFDRIDNSKGYSFENIKLMTWKQNIANASKSAKNGEFKGLTKSIVCENVETGEILEFVSGAEAKRVLGICRSGISSACIGKYKTNIYKGYRWSFKY